MNYIPDLINTDEMILPDDILAFIKQLAGNTHDRWAQQRLIKRWRYGLSHDAEGKQHPCLVDHDHLPESEKETIVLVVYRVSR